MFKVDWAWAEKLVLAPPADSARANQTAARRSASLARITARTGLRSRRNSRAGQVRAAPSGSIFPPRRERKSYTRWIGNHRGNRAVRACWAGPALLRFPQT